MDPKPATNGGVVPRLRSLLGDVVLLGWSPGVKGEKKPWKHLTVEAMTPEYLARLEHQNIGVALGKKSGGICSIDIDHNEDVEPFLKLNPRLRDTLRTKGVRGCNVWVRVRGECPPLTSLNRSGTQYGEWRADGGQTIIHGRHPSGCDYQIVRDAAPVEISFADIKWPEGVEADFLNSKRQDNRADTSPGDALSELTAQYGEPFHRDEHKVITSLNQRFWAGVMLKENFILHEPMERGFYLYNAERGLWQSVTADALVERLAQRLFEHRRLSGEQLVERQISHARLKPIVELMRGMAERRDAFERRAQIIHVANGVIRLEGNRTLLECFSPEHYSRNQSPIPFNEQAECPRFINELLAPALCAEDIDLLKRWAGVALYGRNLPQRILILDGMPNGGKSTVANILSQIVGIENCYQLRTASLTGNFETFRYRGKTLLMGVDVPGDFLQHKGASVVKHLVGGDFISVEQKCGNGDFHVRGNFSVLITSNSRLRAKLDGDSGAWLRRLMIIRYEQPPVARRILDFDKLLLREEGSGILRWALDGFQLALAEFEATGDFHLTDAQKGRVESLLAESDSVERFLADCVERGEDDITSNELTLAYAHFCSDHGWNALPPTVIVRMFDDLMLRLFMTTKANSINRDGKPQKGWRRVRFKSTGAA